MSKFLIELQTRLDEAKLKSNINSYISTFGKYLKAQFTEAGKSFTQWLSAGSLASALIAQLKKIPEEVMEVNAAMTELRKNSSASADSLKKYFDEAADSAKALGVSVSDIIRTTADWSRLGYSLPDAGKLAEAAALFQNIGGRDRYGYGKHLPCRRAAGIPDDCG